MSSTCAFNLFPDGSKSSATFYKPLYSLKNGIHRSNRGASTSDLDFGITVNVSTRAEGGDLLFEGEGVNDREAMQERLVVRGQIVAIECGTQRHTKEASAKGSISLALENIRWYHDGKLVRV